MLTLPTQKKNPSMNIYHKYYYQKCIQRRENTYKSLSRIINNKSIVFLATDKETCTVILNRKDYQNKVNNVINEGIAEGKHIETVDNTHKDLNSFQDFLYRNLNKHEQ